MASPAKRQRTQDYAPPSALESLPPLSLGTIIAMVGPRGAATLACTCATLRAAASAEACWRRFCADDLGLDAPLDPGGRPLPSFKGAYKAWFQSFHMYPLPLVKRVKSFWSSMKIWLSEYFPEALETLAEGVSDIEVQSAEYDLGFQLPKPMKVLYRFCNGQMHYSQDLASLGIIGGYEFKYDKVNVHLLPLKQIVETSKLLRSESFAFGRSNYIVVATSSYEHKSFILDCLSGQLYVGNKSLKIFGEMISCVPKSLIRLHIDDNNDMPQDGLLLWLEEHLRCLQSGLIKVQRYTRGSNARHISLYLEAPPSCSSAVTHGIKVHVSSVFVPEISSFYDIPSKYVYYYCIHQSLPEACTVDGKCYSSCQLQSCHLTIRTGNDVLHDDWECNVLLLKQGSDEVIYGCCELSMVPASIEGSITFVPLRYYNPGGNHFVVKIAHFPLELPEYIF